MKTEKEIIDDISLGEDSTRQFKVKLNDTLQIAKEMCAMSNSNGGIIYIGVADNHEIIGIDAAELRKYNPWIADAANQMIKPAIYPLTQTIKIKDKIILTIEITKGVAKPYCDNKGIYWIKSGSDNRTASPQDLLRLFQESTQIYLDETSTNAPIVKKEENKEEWGIDLAKFYIFFEKNFGQEVSATGLKIEQLLVNMNLAKDTNLTLAGLLLFGNNVQGFKPYCLIRAIAFIGVEISDDHYNDKRDCIGTLEEQFRSAIAFLKNNLSQIQMSPSFNSKSSLEIDERALEEAIVNTLIHRDYSKNAVIRLFIFKDRVEIISPGSLPNHLNVENIKNGNSVMRNPLLASFGTKILPYSGIGSGIPRILKNHPETDIVNDKDGGQFKITFKRVHR